MLSVPIENTVDAGHGTLCSRLCCAVCLMHMYHVSLTHSDAEERWIECAAEMWRIGAVGNLVPFSSSSSCCSVYLQGPHICSALSYDLQSWHWEALFLCRASTSLWYGAELEKYLTQMCFVPAVVLKREGDCVTEEGTWTSTSCQYMEALSQSDPLPLPPRVFNHLFSLSPTPQCHKLWLTTSQCHNSHSELLQHGQCKAGLI